MWFYPVRTEYVCAVVTISGNCITSIYYQEKYFGLNSTVLACPKLSLTSMGALHIQDCSVPEDGSEVGEGGEDTGSVNIRPV